MGQCWPHAVVRTAERSGNGSTAPSAVTLPLRCVQHPGADGRLFATASLVISLCSVTLEGTTTSEPLHAKPTDESDAYTAELALRALAVAALWISQSFRVLGRSVTFGPLTFMFLKMTEDVFRFVVLMGGVVLGAAPHTCQTELVAFCPPLPPPTSH